MSGDNYQAALATEQLNFNPADTSPSTFLQVLHLFHSQDLLFSILHRIWSLVVFARPLESPHKNCVCREAPSYRFSRTSNIF